jgi:hypothetical protein
MLHDTTPKSVQGTACLEYAELREHLQAVLPLLERCARALPFLPAAVDAILKLGEKGGAELYPAVDAAIARLAAADAACDGLASDLDYEIYRIRRALRRLS